MAQELNKEEDCRLVYVDIVRGYSLDESGTYYIKHFTELDTAETERKRQLYLREATRFGLTSEKERLDVLARFGHWSTEDEQSYQTAIEEITGLEISARKLIIPSQKEEIEARIQTKRRENQKNFTTRAQLLGLTKETHANRKAAEHHILSSFYKDSALSVPQFSQEELDNLSENDLQIFMDIYRSTHEVFSEKNMKRIAVCPFFLSAYLVSNDNPYFFFGKHIAYLTIYQLSLFGRGSYYKMIMEETPARPPDEFYEDLSQVIRFYDQQYSIILGKRNKSK